MENMLFVFLAAVASLSAVCGDPSQGNVSNSPAEEQYNANRVTAAPSCEDQVELCFRRHYNTEPTIEDWVYTRDTCLPSITTECQDKADSILIINNQIKQLKDFAVVILAAVHCRDQIELCFRRHYNTTSTIEDWIYTREVCLPNITTECHDKRDAIKTISDEIEKIKDSVDDLEVVEPDEEVVIERVVAPIEEHPWQVSLQWNPSASPQGGPPKPPYAHHCVGTIIAEDWVLTAASCIFLGGGKDKFQHQYFVMAGSADISTHRSVQVYGIREVIVHEDYELTWSDQLLHPNDVALIKIDGRFTFNDKVQKVDLAVDQSPLAFTNCQASGWGEGSTLDAVDYTLVGSGPCKRYIRNATIAKLAELKEEEVDDYLKDSAKEADILAAIVNTTYSQQANLMEILDTMVCVTNQESVMPGGCPGYPGGPLVCSQGDKATSKYLVGVYVGRVATNLTDSCGASKLPVHAIYTRVGAFHRWICKHLGEPFCNPACTKVSYIGKCLNIVEGFGFNPATRNCERFSDVACDVTGERFDDWGQCMQTCTSVCLMPKETGMCSETHYRFFFNTISGLCEPFKYGGCGANGNNFKDLPECQVACSAGITKQERSSVCSQALVITDASCGDGLCEDLKCPAFAHAECRAHGCAYGPGGVTNGCTARWWLQGGGVPEHDVTHACRVAGSGRDLGVVQKLKH